MHVSVIKASVNDKSDVALNILFREAGSVGIVVDGLFPSKSPVWPTRQ